MSLNYPAIQRLGTAVPLAADITTDVGSFNNNLGAGDVDVQEALETLDDLAVSYTIKNVRNEVNDYTVVPTDGTIIADGTSNTVTITLPAAPATGQVFNIACINSTNAVDVDFNSKNFYDSATNEVLFKGENLTVQYNGTYWVSA